MATGRIGTTPVLTTRWSKAPAAGTTSLSGLDDNSVSLVYSVGYEAVYQNGVLLSRGNDYTATDGTTITLTTATVAGDIIEVFANQLVPLTDAISKGQFTAKGALLSASAASTPAVLTVGSNDQVLTADSSTATGLKWAAVSSGTPAFVGCIATKDTTDQTISTGTETAVTFNGESIDTDGFHSTTTNTSRFTIPSGKAGKYLFIFSGTFAANATGVREVYAYKNGLAGTILTQGTLINSLTNNVLSIQCSFICDLAVGDYVEMIVWQTSGGSLALKANSGNTIAQMQYLGA